MATVVALVQDPILRFVNNDGTPCIGGSLLTTVGGSAFPTWSESTGTIQNTNPIILNARGEIGTNTGVSSPLFVSPNVAYTFILSDANGNLIWSAPNIVSPSTINAVLSGLTQASLLSILNFNLQTPAEFAANVTVVNFQYPPLCVDRYLTNSVSGGTPMAAAFQSAINVAKQIGGTITFGDTGQYLIEAPLDLTTPIGGATVYSFTIRGEAHMAAYTTNTPYLPSIILQHTGHGFDCTGNLGLNFENMGITTDTSTFPDVCFLMARNTDARSQICRFNNVRVYGWFSDSVFYNYGSEDDVHVGCEYINANPATTGSTAVMRLTANNISGLTSTFTTISTGVQSTIDHTFDGCQFQNLSTSATADLVLYDAVSDARFNSCWAYMAGGHAMHHHDGAHSVSQSISFRDWVTESDSGQAFFASFLNAAGITSGWRFDNVVSYSSSYFLNCDGALPTLDEFNFTQIIEAVPMGINIPGTLQNSVVYYLGAIVGGGVSSGNELHGNPASWTITRSADKWYDWTAGALAWTPITSALTHGGTLTVTNKRVQYEGSIVTVTCQIQDTTSWSCAAGTLLGGLPIAPSANSGDVVISNASATTGIAGGNISSTSIALPAITVGANVSVIITARYFAA